MKYSIELKSESSKEWIEAALSDIPALLQDHADCERKASAMAMSFVAKFPNRLEIIPELIEIAIEELEHFQQVYELMQKRSISLKNSMTEDLYVKQLIGKCNSGKLERFLDRLLIASVVECRGAERFKLLYENIKNDEELKKFYHELWAAEAKHGNVFVKFALNYFDQDTVYERLNYLMDEEAKVLANLEIKAAFH